jgi:hypothetical protein
MAFNLFEGARRIQLLLQVLWVLGCVVFVWNDTPSLSLKYETLHPAAPFHRTTGECGSEDASEFRYGYDLGDGKRASISLCFKAQPFPNNQANLVPYKVDENGMLWGGPSYSIEVESYTKSRLSQFTLSEAERQSAIEEWWKARLAGLWTAAGFAIGGWIVIALIGGTIGWVVRGFIGDPHNKDTQTNETVSEEE